MSSVVDALVIGGGFFGVEIALELRRLGLGRVVVVERERGILRRASFVNQARVHNGYHYPRSLVTAERSRANFETFVAEYADAVMGEMEKVYAIAAGSRVSPAQFDAFCRVIGAPCRAAPGRIAGLFERGMVQEAFLTRELVFDAGRLAARLGRAMREAGVEVQLGVEARVLGAEGGGVEVGVGGEVVRAHHVVNCTYADIAFAGVALRSRVRREMAEMVLVEAPPELRGMGITVMDGPFFSVLPFPAAGAGVHSLSHVRYTPHGANDDGEAGGLAPSWSNRDAMVRDGARYLPCLGRARVMGSVFEVKATLARHEGDDGRPVLVERSEAMPRVLSVLGAKIDNIYEIRRFLRGQDWSCGVAA